MRTTVILFLCTIAFTSFNQTPKYFSGKIVYRYQLKNVNDSDITDALAKFIGKEQHYFINDINYKAYDEVGSSL